MIWRQTPWNLRNKRLHHCQKLTVVFVTNTCVQSTYLINCLKVKASAQNVHFWYKHKLSDVYTPFTGASFINDCLLQPMLHVNYPLLQFTDITDPLLSTVASFFCRFYSHRIRTWAIKAALHLVRLILLVSHAISHCNRQQL